MSETTSETTAETASEDAEVPEEQAVDASESAEIEELSPTGLDNPVEITLDGEAVLVEDGELLIDACERGGVHIPRFCYHPRLTPVGMCRMCLVEVDSGRGPTLQPSCMLPVTAGMQVDSSGPKVVKAQEGVLEFLLANHPLDCPVCDKGGECPLQDQTYSYGPGESRFVEEKRHREKPIAISDTVLLDRERCILCDRCTRFADEVAGDPLIHFIHRGAESEVNTFPGHPFASYFSGNTVQICPVGALTAKPYRFKARPWDLQSAESTCTRCSVGCRIAVESSRNTVVRLQGVDVDPVNWGWLCDKGRYGFEAFNSEDRLRGPLVRSDGGELEPARWADALATASELLSGALAKGGPASVGVLGGARCTDEAAYAWARLAKAVIGTDNVDCQMGDGLPAELVLGLPGATIDEACAPGATVLYLGPDPKEELPVLFLRLKHAVANDGVTLVEVGPIRTGLSRYATHFVSCLPGESAATVAGLLAGDPATDPATGAAGAALRAAGDDLVVLIGRGNLAEAGDLATATVEAVRSAVPGARFLPLLPRGNVRGALEAGLAPGLLPGRQPLGAPAVVELWGSSPTERGLDAAGILEAAANGRIDVLVLLGADPLVDFPDRSLARRAIAGVRSIISVDPFLNASSQGAQVVLAAAAFAEVSGTTTSCEGRVSVLDQKVTPVGTARADWLIAVELAARLGADLGVRDGEGDLWAQMCSVSPAHAGLGSAELAAAEDGLVLDPGARELDLPRPMEPPAANAYSQRLVVHRELYDRGELLQHSPSSVALARPTALRLSPADAAPLGVSSGTRVKVTSPNGSLTVSAAVDAEVPKGVVVMVHNVEGADPGNLVASGDAVCDVRVEVA
jgi:NADH-quinone oxidoreductase subunit G